LRRAWGDANVDGVIGAIIVIVIILVIAAGFWLTRGAGRPKSPDR
jgi:hypothetical protein